ncbi:MAG: hypothetical protein HY820_42145 [Acidobacteria bacterium]|nr:hypothetical protein [Acidobacteriota bacterium]
MSHFTSGDGKKRLSLDTIHATSGGSFTIGVWGMTDALKLVVSEDKALDVNKLKPGDLRPQVLGVDAKVATITKLNKIPNTEVTVYKIQMNKVTGVYRLELQFGVDVWDWARLQCGAKPAVAEDTSKGTGYLNVHVVWATPPPPVSPLPHCSTVASLLLEKHGFKLRVTPSLSWYGVGDKPTIQGFESGVVCTKDIGNVPALSTKVKALPAYQSNKLIVVMANARTHTDPDKDPGNLAGQTVPEGGELHDMDECKTIGVKKGYIIINVNNRAIDGATLVHEMGHVVGFCGHIGDHTKLMSYGVRRNQVQKGQIAQFQSAFFHSDV